MISLGPIDEKQAPRDGTILVRIDYVNHDEGLSTWKDIGFYLRLKLDNLGGDPFTMVPRSIEDLPGRAIGPGRRYIDERA
jgi:hypothetical protein